MRRVKFSMGERQAGSCIFEDCFMHPAVITYKKTERHATFHEEVLS